MRPIDWEIIRLNATLEQPKRKTSPEERKRLKKKKRRKKRIKTIKWLYRKTIKWTLICIGIITVYLNGMPKLYDAYLKANGTFSTLSQEEADDRIQKIEHMMQLNELYYDKESTNEESKERLATYDIEKDKLKISNVGSYNSTGGMCLGFSMFEKFNYMDALQELNERLPEEIRLSDPSRQDLGNILLDEEDNLRLYGGSRLKAGTWVNLDSKTQYDIYTRAYRVKREDFSAKVKNDQAREILNAINYIQGVANSNREEYPQIEIKPNAYVELSTAVYFNHPKRKIKETLEPSLITEKIDADEPVVIGINNIRDGHALMAYAYDYVAEDVLKIYVSDSNYTILDEETKDEERLKNIKSFNQDVRENIYILCVKDRETDRWEYIYNPRVNHNYTYEGGYNSYIPDTSIAIYQ